VLDGVARLSAPVSPFMSELLWKELQGDNRDRFGQPLSVHMTAFPTANEALIDKELEDGMGMAEKIVSLGRAARSRHNLKVRQPLARLIISLPSDKRPEQLGPYLDIIRNELNIKKVEISDSTDTYMQYAAKLNFRLAGPKLGKEVKQAAALLAELEPAELRKFAVDKKLALKLGDGLTVELTDEEVEVSRLEKEGFAVEAEGGITVVLATGLTEELRDEGFAREMVNKIQNMRKTSGLNVTDRIRVRVVSTSRLQTAASRFMDFICDETLAQELVFTKGIDNGNNVTEWNINGEKAAIEVIKV